MLSFLGIQLYEFKRRTRSAARSRNFIFETVICSHNIMLIDSSLATHPCEILFRCWNKRDSTPNSSRDYLGHTLSDSAQRMYEQVFDRGNNDVHLTAWPIETEKVF